MFGADFWALFLETSGVMFDEQFWLRVISGGRVPRPLGSLLRAILWLLTPIYWLAVSLRALAYRWGWKKTVAADLAVISLGNLTTGGTGKSPLVIWLAEQLRDRGRRVCVLSRGYRGLAPGENDESLELAARLPDVPQLIDPDRVASARIASEELEMEVALLDDGFQHRRLQRQLDLVLIDATQPFGYGYLLPRGLLREPKSSLRRADRLIITRAGQVTLEQLTQLRRELERYRPATAIAVTTTAPVGLIQADGRVRPWSELQGQTVLGFCGLGNPGAFFRTVEGLGCELKRQCSFADHHHYTESDLGKLSELGRGCRATALVCAHKDLVKIGRNELGGIPLFAVLIEVQFLEGERELLAAVEAVLPVEPPERLDA